MFIDKDNTCKFVIEEDHIQYCEYYKSHNQCKECSLGYFLLNNKC